MTSDFDSEFDSAGVAQLRPKLLAVAYRMLGSAADAEDAVQDAFVRFHETAGVENPEAWLVKATTRLSIDRLRQAKRRAGYVGPWLPEPVPEHWEGAAMDRTELAESLSTAFLLLLETLSPVERAAYLLREAFEYEFDEIGALLDKTPVNVRQIVARAKRRIGAKDTAEKRFEADAGEADELASRFFAACQSGDLDAIESMLAADVTMYSDGGGKVYAAPAPLHDRKQIAKLLSVVFRKLQQFGSFELTTVNGQPGATFTVEGRVVDVISLAMDGGMVQEVFAVLNPDKLVRWS
jgi:RNA polymerase sigma-70 factor (ECF subfamily)